MQGVVSSIMGVFCDLLTFSSRTRGKEFDKISEHKHDILSNIEIQNINSLTLTSFGFGMRSIPTMYMADVAHFRKSNYGYGNKVCTVAQIRVQ